MRLPDDVYATVVRLSAPYAVTGTPDGYTMGSILNAIAWAHRADGWGLSRKTGGKRVDSPVGEIAEDILHHQPTNLLWDIWQGADVGQPLNVGGGAPWDIGPPESADRAWVAPVQPVGTSAPPPPDPTPTPPPSTDLSAIKAQLATVIAQQQVILRVLTEVATRKAVEDIATKQQAVIDGLFDPTKDSPSMLEHIDDVKHIGLSGGRERGERFR